MIPIFQADVVNVWATALILLACLGGWAFGGYLSHKDNKEHDGYLD